MESWKVIIFPKKKEKFGKNVGVNDFTGMPLSSQCIHRSIFRFTDLNVDFGVLIDQTPLQFPSMDAWFREKQSSKKFGPCVAKVRGCAECLPDSFVGQNCFFY